MMNIGRRIKEIYDVDFGRLIDELKVMSRQERMMLYEVHSKRLFPKSKKTITLEEQLNDNHKVDREKFRMCFRVVCGEFFSTDHFGEYCKRRFMKKTGLNTQTFPQKVILALSLMGYIREQGLKCNYSTGNHGYIYQVDYMKFSKMEQDFFAESAVEDEAEDYDVPIRVEFPDLEREWLEENGLPYDTDKDLRNRIVLQFHKADPTRSSRDIEKLCADAGVKVSYRTVQKIVAENIKI